MKVIFYEIYNCDYEMIENFPVIIAPGDTDTELLRKYCFVKLIDGRWAHYLTQAEIFHIENNRRFDTVIFCNDEYIRQTDAQLQTDYEARSGIGFTLFMVFLFILGFLIVVSGSPCGKYISYASFLALFISALRSNKSAAITVLIILISIPIIFVICVMLVIAACSEAINDCGGEAEAVGRMGSLLLSF